MSVQAKMAPPAVPAVAPSDDAHLSTPMGKQSSGSMSVTVDPKSIFNGAGSTAAGIVFFVIRNSSFI